MYFSDYIWVNGKPKGKSIQDPLSENIVYKIVKDPYGKRISLERFLSGFFLDCPYDSHLFDFRVLISKVENSWQKIDSGTIERPSSLIRDHNDRTIAQEFYQFENGFCKECHIHYPNGQLVAKQKMIYHGVDNNLSAMVLFDSLEHAAGLKEFHRDGSCLFESWDMSDAKVQDKFKALVI